MAVSKSLEMIWTSVKWLKLSSKLQYTVQNMSILCPNFGHILDTCLATNNNWTLIWVMMFVPHPTSPIKTFTFSEQLPVFNRKADGQARLGWTFTLNLTCRWSFAHEVMGASVIWLVWHMWIKCVQKLDTFWAYFGHYVGSLDITIKPLKWFPKYV